MSVQATIGFRNGKASIKTICASDLKSLLKLRIRGYYENAG